jgi:DNA-binding PadR family transcriptional regulator
VENGNQVQGQYIHFESSIVESGMKRYSLTEKGKEFFEEQVKYGQKFLEKLEWIAPMLVGGFHFGNDNENLLYARESAKRVLETFMELHANQDKLTKQDVQEIAKILDDSNRTIKKIAQRIKNEKPT